MAYNLRGCIWSLQRFCAFIMGANNQPPSPGQLKSIAWDQSFEAHSAINYFLACGRRSQDRPRLLHRQGAAQAVAGVDERPGQEDRAVRTRDVGSDDCRVLEQQRRAPARLPRAIAAPWTDRDGLPVDGEPSGALRFFCGLPSNPGRKRHVPSSGNPPSTHTRICEENLPRSCQSCAKWFACCLRASAALIPRREDSSSRAPLTFDQAGEVVPVENDVEDLLRTLATQG